MAVGVQVRGATLALFHVAQQSRPVICLGKFDTITDARFLEDHVGGG